MSFASEYRRIAVLSTNSDSRAVVLSKGDVAPKEISASQDIFGCHNLGEGAIDIEFIESRVLLDF